MNPIAEEIKAFYEESIEDLTHYGTPRHSGRYPWGSGNDPYQRTGDFLARVEELKKQGWKETSENIEEEFGLTTKEYRNEKSIARYERRKLDVERARSLKEDGLGATEIGRKMGIPESTVRSLLDDHSEEKMMRTMETVNFLKKRCDEKGMIDVGTGVDKELNISKERLDTALYYLETREGYPVYKGGIPQVTNQGQQTNQRVLCIPGTEHKEIYNYENVHPVNDYISRDDGTTFEKKFTYPESMDSKRLQIRYNEEGGLEKDGCIELRRGVPDLSLGESRYSQVRILVDGTHYIKGMAVYSDDMPDGVDVIFNTNKKQGTPMTDVLKKIKADPDNPFGSAIKDADKGGQYWYDDKTGKIWDPDNPVGKKKLGLINKRADEGDWTEWKDALPSQFLAKQSKQMAEKQLNLAKADKMEEYDEICNLDNPTVKKHFLEKFASSCDAAAVNLQAAALPGQKYHVIIPITSIKDTEVYAPGYEPGTKLALIRYPHGGTFEIPILTVNNKNQTARSIIGTDPIDAIGLNSKVAERLSGADFDGDTVMCIPTHDKSGKVKITSTPPLKELEGFDPKLSYGYDRKTVDADGTEHYYRNGSEFRKMKNTGTQMGVVSNLITDMTLKGASPEELARAVKHSMVVIDAEKHKLDYKQSEIDNNIAALKKTYQTRVDSDGTVHTGGASTLLSRSKGETTVLKRQGAPKINIKGKPYYDPSKPEGSLVYTTADDLEYTVSKTNKKTGEVTTVTKYRKQKSTRMAETDDAYTLTSDPNNPFAMESLYADYANSMKKLANEARKTLVSTGKIAYSVQAKNKYRDEVYSLDEKLRTALLNTTKEREAQRRTNAEIKAKQQANPDMKADELKKARQQSLTANRENVGSVSRRDRSIAITDREWEAIQAGAISENKLKQILNNADIDELRQRATPRTNSVLSQAKVNRIVAMNQSNYTLGEIASALGVSSSTVSKYLKGANQ